MTDTDSPRVDMSWPALMRRAHSVEHAENWQYAVVWCFAAEGDPVDLDDPPTEGTGWERNIDRADEGREVRVPAWSDGSKVMHLSYWRRKSPGMKPWHPQHKLHEQREGGVMSETTAKPATFDFGDNLGYEHRIGDPKCSEGRCGSFEYPKQCQEPGCSGLIHANFGDENYDGDYWFYTKCDVCGETE